MTLYLQIISVVTHGTQNINNTTYTTIYLILNLIQYCQGVNIRDKLQKYREFVTDFNSILYLQRLYYDVRLLLNYFFCNGKNVIDI